MSTQNPLEKEEIYARFLRAVSRQKIIWGMRDNHKKEWLTGLGPKNDQPLFPLWTSRKMAASAFSNRLGRFSPEPLPLKDFVSPILPPSLKSSFSRVLSLEEPFWGFLDRLVQEGFLPTLFCDLKSGSYIVSDIEGFRADLAQKRG
jgi:hypothetical protein